MIYFKGENSIKIIKLDSDYKISSEEDRRIVKGESGIYDITVDDTGNLWFFNYECAIYET